MRSTSVYPGEETRNEITRFDRFDDRWRHPRSGHAARHAAPGSRIVCAAVEQQQHDHDHYQGKGEEAPSPFQNEGNHNHHDHELRQQLQPAESVTASHFFTDGFGEMPEPSVYPPRLSQSSLHPA